MIAVFFLFNGPEKLLKVRDPKKRNLVTSRNRSILQLPVSSL